MKNKHLFIIWGFFVLIILTGAGCIKNPPANGKISAPREQDLIKLPPQSSNPVDGASMVLIPRGEFIMGPLGKGSRKIQLEDFYIYKNEVTNDQFKKFTESTGYKAEGNWDKWVTEGTGSYPVVMVTWNDAKAYCRWAEADLPTEAQWEKAARGADGRIYPWGNRFDPSFCNCSQTPLDLRRGKTRMLYKNTGILPVGFFNTDCSPYGVMDMGGNVCEWTADWFSDDYPPESGTAPTEGDDKVIKGGSFYKNPENCKIFFRDDAEKSHSDTDCGFRCIKYPKRELPGTAAVTPIVSKTDESAQKDGIIKETNSAPKIRKNVNLTDGAVLIRIPAGTSTMGAADFDKDAREPEKPKRKVYLDSYYIYKHEVTYGQFKKFTGATGYKAEGPWKSHYKKEIENHPVVYITWKDADAYCRWAGGKLPTEAQWEKAARGPNGYIYGWGNKWNPNLANVLETKDPKIRKNRHIYYDNLGTTPVGAVATDISPYGLMDITGNVIEWCRDWYDPGYYKHGPTRNPAGPIRGSQKVMRGGGWGQDRRICRLTYRDRERPRDVDGDFGFRCVIEICPDKND